MLPVGIGGYSCRRMEMAEVDHYLQGAGRRQQGVRPWRAHQSGQRYWPVGEAAPSPSAMRYWLAGVTEPMYKSLFTNREMATSDDYQKWHSIPVFIEHR